jgi:hypothetical protein
MATTSSPATVSGLAARYGWRFFAVLALAFIAGVLAVPYIVNPAPVTGTIQELTAIAIVLLLAVPPLVLLMVAVEATTRWTRSTITTLAARLAQPQNIWGRRVLRSLAAIRFGGQIAATGIETGVSMVGGFIALVLGLLISLFVLGGAIGLLVIGWRALGG